MGYLTERDVTLYRSWFKECCRLRGIPVLYRYPVKVDPTIHSEMISELSEEIPMDIIFETNPKTSTLKQIHWVSELPNDKPYIAILPFDAPNLCTECVIRIRPIDSLNDQYRDFKITSINTLLEFPESWTCTLAPIFETKDGTPKNDYSNSNYNYIDGDKTTSEEYSDTYEEGYSYIKVKDQNRVKENNGN